MTLAYGFFNSVGGDRVYDAEDFSRYLEGILANGCFPNDTGFKALANPDPIGANPPSIIISAGKAYYDGMWVYNPQNYIYSLGTEQQSTPGMIHLVYFCYDTNDAGREVTIECLTSANPVMPSNGAGKYYMPLARIVDQLNAQPLTAHITDQRLEAGVVAVSVDTSSLVDESVTTPKLGALSVTTEKIGNKEVTTGKIADNAVGLLQLAESGVYLGSFNSSFDPAHGPTQNLAYDFPTNGIVLQYTPIMDVNLFVFGTFTGEHISPGIAGVSDYYYSLRNSAGTVLASNNYLHNGGANQAFGGGIALVIPLMKDTAYTLISVGTTSLASHLFANCRATGIIFALPR